MAVGEKLEHLTLSITQLIETRKVGAPVGRGQQRLDERSDECARDRQLAGVNRSDHPLQRGGGVGGEHDAVGAGRAKVPRVPSRATSNTSTTR